MAAKTHSITIPDNTLVPIPPVHTVHFTGVDDFDNVGAHPVPPTTVVEYYIEVRGEADPNPDDTSIDAVYAAVFPDNTLAANGKVGTIPTDLEQPRIIALIANRTIPNPPPKGHDGTDTAKGNPTTNDYCVKGQPHNLNNVGSYVFLIDPNSGSDYQPVAARKFRSPNNWLQVYVKFSGETNYKASSNGPIQFTPVV